MEHWTILSIFTKHPHSIGETYFQHMRKAMIVAFKIQIIVFIILIHSIFPFLFEHTGGDEIEKINKELQHRKKGQYK
tara:strand:+ start:313 stop:543 length:231 start_codon:yes stop_codon:yes gene_type:complete